MNPRNGSLYSQKDSYCTSSAGLKKDLAIQVEFMNLPQRKVAFNLNMVFLNLPQPLPLISRFYNLTNQPTVS